MGEGLALGHVQVGGLRRSLGRTVAYRGCAVLWGIWTHALVHVCRRTCGPACVLVLLGRKMACNVSSALLAACACHDGNDFGGGTGESCTFLFLPAYACARLWVYVCVRVGPYTSVCSTL